MSRAERGVRVPLHICPGQGEVFADSKDAVDAKMKESPPDLCAQKGQRPRGDSTVTEVQEARFPQIWATGHHALEPKQLRSGSAWGGRINFKVPSGSFKNAFCLFVLLFAYF